MKPSDLTICVVDSGQFFSVAERLARGFKRTLYQCTIDQPFPKANEACIGVGYGEIERIRDFWPIKDEIDIFVFPDCTHAGLQNELVSQGFKVWGSRDSVRLEMDRIGFKDVLKEVGLEVGTYHVCHGLTALGEYLLDKKDQFIKLPQKFRGNGETRRWIDHRHSSNLLLEYETQFGATAEHVPFLVEDKIETEIEFGLDTYFCAGKFPGIVAHGPEVKDKCYAGAVVKWGDLPSQLRDVAEAMQPVLKRLNCCNAVSMEVRITKDGQAFFTDPTQRFASPAGGACMELWTNWPEIIVAGVNGECLDPEYENNFAVEAIMDHCGNDQGWRTIIIPDAIKRWVKLYSPFKKADEIYEIPPFPHSGDAIGSVVGVGETMEAAIEHLKANAKELENVHVHVADLADALKEIEMAEKQNVDFSGQEMPEASIALP